MDSPRERSLAVIIAGLIGLVLLLGMVFLSEYAPKTQIAPGPVTTKSAITYKIGEKIKAQPYNDQWLDGTVTAITSEDNYIVNYCGNIDWFHSWKCETNELTRAQMAKEQL